MSTLAEIEAAIECLSAKDVEELSAWLRQRDTRGTGGLPVETWLKRARGAAVPGATTDALQALTRGEQ
jgi:hypothetical protein